MKSHFIKRKYLEKILSGEKSLETRVGYPRYSYRKGDIVYLNRRYPVVIRDVRRYPNYERALCREDLGSIIPGCGREEALAVCNRIYPRWKQRKHGVLVFEIECIAKK